MAPVAVLEKYHHRPRIDLGVRNLPLLPLNPERASLICRSHVTDLPKSKIIFRYNLGSLSHINVYYIETAMQAKSALVVADLNGETEQRKMGLFRLFSQKPPTYKLDVVDPRVTSDYVKIDQTQFDLESIRVHDERGRIAASIDFHLKEAVVSSPFHNELKNYGFRCTLPGVAA